MHALGMAELLVLVLAFVSARMYIKRKEKIGLINIPNMTYRNRNHIELCFQPQLRTHTRKTEETRPCMYEYGLQ